jgi:hypothetical protein
MFNLGLAPIEFRPRRSRALPREGQRVRITVDKEVELWQGSSRVRFYEGDVYEGTVAAVGEDGLLELHVDDGRQLQIHARDVSFVIDPVE